MSKIDTGADGWSFSDDDFWDSLDIDDGKDPGIEEKCRDCDIRADYRRAVVKGLIRERPGRSMSPQDKTIVAHFRSSLTRGEGEYEKATAQRLSQWLEPEQTGETGHALKLVPKGINEYLMFDLAHFLSSADIQYEGRKIGYGDYLPKVEKGMWDKNGCEGLKDEVETLIRLCDYFLEKCYEQRVINILKKTSEDLEGSAAWRGVDELSLFQDEPRELPKPEPEEEKPLPTYEGLSGEELKQMIVKRRVELIEARISAGNPEIEITILNDIPLHVSRMASMLNETFLQARYDGQPRHREDVIYVIDNLILSRDLHPTIDDHNVFMQFLPKIRQRCMTLGREYNHEHLQEAIEIDRIIIGLGERFVGAYSRYQETINGAREKFNSMIIEKYKAHYMGLFHDIAQNPDRYERERVEGIFDNMGTIMGLVPEIQRDTVKTEMMPELEAAVYRFYEHWLRENPDCEDIEVLERYVEFKEATRRYRQADKLSAKHDTLTIRRNMLYKKHKDFRGDHGSYTRWAVWLMESLGEVEEQLNSSIKYYGFEEPGVDFAVLGLDAAKFEDIFDGMDYLFHEMEDMVFYTQFHQQEGGLPDMTLQMNMFKQLSEKIKALAELYTGKDVMFKEIETNLFVTLGDESGQEYRTAKSQLSELEQKSERYKARYNSLHEMVMNNREEHKSQSTRPLSIDHLDPEAGESYLTQFSFWQDYHQMMRMMYGIERAMEMVSADNTREMIELHGESMESQLREYTEEGRSYFEGLYRTDPQLYCNMFGERVMRMIARSANQFKALLDKNITDFPSKLDQEYKEYFRVLNGVRDSTEKLVRI